MRETSSSVRMPLSVTTMRSGGIRSSRLSVVDLSILDSYRKMEKKILFVDLFTSHGYGTTLVQKIAASFEAAGYIPVILDVESPNAAQILQQCVRNKKEFLFSFSTGWGITEASKIGGKYIHQWLEIPHYASFVDHPLYKQEFIDFRLIDTLYGFTDETQVEFCKAFFYKKGNYSVFPHFSLIEVDEPISEDEFAKKGERVFFSGGATIMERAWSANISSPLQSKAVSSLKKSGIDVEGLIDHLLCKEGDTPPWISLWSTKSDHTQPSRGQAIN